MKALVFRDAARLRRALTQSADARFLGAPCRLLRGQGGTLVLGSEALEGFEVAATPVVEVGLAGRSLTLPGGKREAVAEDVRLATPLLAVPPERWTREPEVRGAAVLLPDEVDYRGTLSAALALGHERMRAAHLDDGRVLLLVEDPSYFLLQRWHETEGRELFWRGQAPDVFLPWGCRHPLERRLRGVDLGGGLYFALPGGTWRRFPDDGLVDVYQGLVLQLDRCVDRTWPARAELPRVEVLMRWGFRPSPAEASLWVLPAPGEVHVERLLGELPEEDLQSLQLAVVEAGDEALFLVRRLSRTSSGRAPGLEVPGLAYAPYAGYGNLFVPAARALEPPIRKDRFRTLLGLVPGEMVLLRPGPADEVTVARFPERGFRSLGSVVEYRIRGAEVRLDELRRAAVFEFEALEFTPVRDPTLVGEAEGPRAPRPAPAAEEAAPEEEDAEAAARPAPARRPATRRAPMRPEVVEVPAADGGAGPDPREAELEDAALGEGAAEDWVRLADYKRAAGKPADALFAAEEAYWRAPEADRPAARGRYRAFLEELLGAGDLSPSEREAAAEARLEEGGDALGVAVRYLALAVAEAGDAEAQRGALARAYRALRGSHLRRKGRWLAWSEVLALSGDRGEEERQREDILGSLSRRGLDPEDRPTYLGRYLRGRAGLEEWMEQVDLPALLELLDRAARSIAPGPFRVEAQALYLRTWIEADREGKGPEKLAEFPDLLASLEEPSLVALGHHAGALATSDPEAAGQRFRELLGRVRALENPPDRVFVHLFENMLFADSFTGAQTVLLPALEVLRELPPARCARVLPEVARTLVELGARVEVAELARGLLRERTITEDLFMVERVAVALRAALDPEPLSEADWEVIAASIETSRERFDILYLDLVEDAAVGLGKEFLDRLEARIEEEGEGGAYPGLILGACRLKLLAEENRAAEGLGVIEAALPACWGLGDPLRARALGRYVRALAHLGNVARGTELLQGVIEAAYARDNQELEEFYRSEILGEVARAAGQLGDPARAVEVLEAILDGVERRLESSREDVSLLFEVLSKGIEVLLDLGEWSAGGPLVERIEQVIRDRVASHEGVQRGPWFFLHKARVVCARALLYMGRDEAGARALAGALDDFRRVSSLDRTDLLEEAAAVLPYVDGAARRETLGRMVGLMEQTEDIGEYDRKRRGEVVMALAAAVRPGADAYRREQSRWDALEARSIRRRVASSHPAEREAGRVV